MKVAAHLNVYKLSLFALFLFSIFLSSLLFTKNVSAVLLFDPGPPPSCTWDGSGSLCTTTSLSDCQNNIGPPSNSCNTSNWTLTYATSCQVCALTSSVPGEPGPCDFSFQYNNWTCSVADTCQATPYLYPGICDVSAYNGINPNTACVAGSTIYKTCCNSDGTVDGVCSGGLHTGTCTSAVTVICGVSSCAGISAPCTTAACGTAACRSIAPTPTPTSVPVPTAAPTATPIPTVAPGGNCGAYGCNGPSLYTSWTGCGWCFYGFKIQLTKHNSLTPACAGITNPCIDSATTTNLNYTFTGLSPSTLYDLYIFACNDSSCNSSSLLSSQSGVGPTGACTGGLCSTSGGCATGYYKPYYWCNGSTCVKADVCGTSTGGCTSDGASCSLGGTPTPTPTPTPTSGGGGGGYVTIGGNFVNNNAGTLSIDAGQAVTMKDNNTNTSYNSLYYYNAGSVKIGYYQQPPPSSSYTVTATGNAGYTISSCKICADARLCSPYNYCTLSTDYTGPSSVSVSLPNNRDYAYINFMYRRSGYSVSGNVFLDNNKNGIKDGSETNYTAPSTIKVDNGASGCGASATTISTSGGSYSTNLSYGTHSICYTPPASYQSTFPVPVYFTVTVSAGTCTISPSTFPDNSSIYNPPTLNGVSCDTTSKTITNLNFGISNFYPWIQSTGTDLRFDPGFKDPIPAVPACGPGPYASIPSTGGTPGIVFIGSSSPTDPLTFGPSGQASQNPYNWVVGLPNPETYAPPGSSGVVPTSYNYLSSLITQAGQPTTPLSGCNNPSGCTLPAGAGVYTYNGDVYINASNLDGGNYIFLINGNIHILGNITVANGSTATFSSSGSIYVNDASITNASNEVTEIDGYYSADKDFIVNGRNSCSDPANIDKPLKVEGTIVVNAALQGGSFKNNRDLCGGDTCPAVSVSDRPDFILNAPSTIKYPNTTYREAAP